MIIDAFTFSIILSRSSSTLIPNISLPVKYGSYTWIFVPKDCNFLIASSGVSSQFFTFDEFFSIID